MTRLSIITVGYNSRTEIEALLASLSAPAPHTSHEIIVVDNASSDGTAAYVRDQWPGVRLVASETNVGFARANNLALRQASSEFVLLLNPDAVVPPGAVDRLVQSLDSHPERAVVGPRIVDGSGRAELSFGAMMSPWTELRQKILVWGNDRGLPPLTTIVGRMTRRSRNVDWVSGACLMIRRADFAAVGGFDERFFMYAEDVDLCAAVRARGRHVYFDASTQVVHLRGRSAATAVRATRLAHRRSQLAFYEKHHPRWVPLLRAYLKVRGRLPDTPS